MSKYEKALFDLPLATTGGNIVCTEPAKQVYLLTWTSNPDNRLTTVSPMYNNMLVPIANSETAGLLPDAHSRVGHHHPEKRARSRRDHVGHLEILL